MKHSVSMMMTLALTLAGSAAPAADSPPPLTCSTVALKTQVVPGEFLILRDVLRNTMTSKVMVVGDDQWGFAFRLRTRAVGGDWQLSAFWPPEGMPSGDPPFASFQPGEEIQALYVMARSLPQAVGVYEVQRVLRYSLWPDFTKPPAGAWAGNLECTPAQVEVVTPTGIDAEAFKALGPYPLSSDRWEILRSYPGSWYAGYVFLGTLGGGIDGSPYSMVWTRDNVRDGIRSGPAYVRPDLEYRAAKYHDQAVLLLAAVQTFLGAHPDFPLSSRLRLKQAGLLAYFERYEEARALAKQALAEADPAEDPIWKRDVQNFLDLLVKKGYLKPE